MYPSNSNFMIPDGIRENVQAFFQNFLLSFSSQDSINNAKKLQEIESDTNTLFYLLEMIRAVLVDENEVYQRYLITATGYFDHLISKIPAIRRYCKEDPEYKTCLISSVLYLLPYAASLFQNKDMIDCFNHLLSVFCNLCCNDSNISEILNPYVTILLKNQYQTPYHQIIAMIFTSKIKLTPENHEMMIQLVMHFLSKSRECDFTFYVARMVYQTIFKDLQRYLFLSILDESVPIDMLILYFSQINQNFISKYSQIPNAACNPEFMFEVDFINYILEFIKEFTSTYKTHKHHKEPSIKVFIKKSYDLIYDQALSLISSSQYHCSKKIIKLLFYNFDLYQIKNTKEEAEYFVNLIFHIINLTKDDIDEVLESEEHFFYDTYDINFESKLYSNRQITAQFLFELIRPNKDNNNNDNSNGTSLIAMFLPFLLSVDNTKLQEQHFYLLSIINIITIQAQLKGEEFLLCLHALTLKFLNAGSNILSNLFTSDCFNNLQSVVFILTYYFLIASSFYILKENEIPLINDEAARLVGIIQNLNLNNSFKSIFFTILCILIDGLMDLKLVTIPIDQLFQFISDNINLCFTNHAITLMNKFALETQNVDNLIKTFDIYMTRCEELLKEFVTDIKNNDDSSYIGIPWETSGTKEFNYSMRYFHDNLEKMARIIEITDLKQFNLERIRNLANLLIIIGDEWSFVAECTGFLSAIISKAQDAKDWTYFYINQIQKYSRIEIYGEWVVPIVHFISDHPLMVDQDFINYMMEMLKKHVSKLYNSTSSRDPRPMLATFDALMLFTLITRIFELGFFDQISISPDDVMFFCKFVDDGKPTDEDNKILDDYLPKDHELGGNILKLAGFLAAPQINTDMIIPFIKYLVETGQIVSEEMRYMIIILIDRVINPEVRGQFLELRQYLLTNKIPKDKTFAEIYSSESSYFVSYDKHPIMKIYQIEEFKHDNEEEEENEGNE